MRSIHRSFRLGLTALPVLVAACSGGDGFSEGGSSTDPVQKRGASAVAAQALSVGPRPARLSSDFVESIGVNTHFNAPNPREATEDYASPAVKWLLAYSGIRHVRDYMVEPGLSAAETGRPYDIKFLLANDSPNVPLSTRVGHLQHAQAVAIEGLNEYDGPNTQRSYDGLTDRTAQRDYIATRAHQFDLFYNTWALGKPVLSPPAGWSRYSRTLAPTASTALGLHCYPNGAAPLKPQFENEVIPDLLQLNGVTSQPIWVSESGYHNAENAPSGNDHKPVSELAAGKYIPRMLAGYFNHNIFRTYLYEFVDEGINNADQEKRFGLIKNASASVPFEPKPAYWAIKNLIALLEDSQTTPFTPGSLDYTLTGQTGDVQQTLLQKRNGTFYLLLWKEMTSYDYAKPLGQRDVAPCSLSAPTSCSAVTLSVNRRAQMTLHYDLKNQNKQHITYNQKSIPILVPDEVVVVEIPGPDLTDTGLVNPVVTINALDADAAEKNTNTATFRVSRTGSTTAALGVTYSVSGSATAVTDYSGLPQPNGSGLRTVTIPVGAQSADVVVTPVADAAVEGAESVALALTAQPAYRVSHKWTAIAEIADDAPDLVITSVRTDPAEPGIVPPNSSASVKLYAKVKNVGTRNIPVGTPVQVQFEPPGQGTLTVSTTVGLAANTEIELSPTTLMTASLGNRFIPAYVNRSGSISEASHRNNYRSYTLPVAARFHTPFNALADWAAQTSWVVQSAGGNSYAVNTSGGTGALSRTVNLDRHWKMDFGYDVRYGAVDGSWQLRVEALNGSSGYRLVVSRQALQLFRVVGGVQQATPIGQVVSSSPYAWAATGSPAFKRLRWVYDRSHRSLTLYVLNNGQLQPAFGPIYDTTPPATTFTQVRISSVADNEWPALDDFQIDSETIALTPIQ